MKVLSQLPIIFLLCKDPYKVSFFRTQFKDVYYIMDVDSCSAAIDWIKSSPIDLIFIDFYSLDEPLGNFCLHLRKILGKKKIPIFLISHIIQKSFITEALSAGVSDFIHEPLDTLEIHERILVQLRSSPLNRKVYALASKIKPPPSIPKHIDLLQHRSLMSNTVLKKIIETKKTTRPLSLYMVQVDRFIQMQKEFGESITKALMDQLELILQAHLRPHDFIIKESPSHYLILLPKTSARAAKIIAEDLRKDVSSTTIRVQDIEVLLTVSIGIISFEKDSPEDSKSFEQFELCLSRVEKALHLANQKGNTIVTAEPPEIG